MSNFESAVKTAAENSILKIISEGAWITPSYENRFKIPDSFMKDIWKMVDVEKLKRHMADRLEEELAERIMNAIAAEIATDVKQILSVKERREVLRGVARNHMEEIMRAGISEEQS